MLKVNAKESRKRRNSSALFVQKQSAEKIKRYKQRRHTTTDIENYKLLPNYALPDHLKDNFILQGHRPELDTFIKCLKSAFKLHTETINIWTHFIGSLCILITGLWYISMVQMESQRRVVFSIFFLGTFFALSASTVYHTFCCYSKKISFITLKLDYCGIIVCITTSSIPWLYYAFYCRFLSKSFYIGSVLLLGALSTMITFHGAFDGDHRKLHRAAMFVAIGLACSTPGIDYLFTEGFWHTFEFLVPLIFTMATYGIGAVVYGARIPERLSPGTFDIWFQSHQIMHICVMVAPFMSLYGMHKLAEYTIGAQGGNCQSSLNNQTLQIIL